MSESTLKNFFSMEKKFLKVLGVLCTRDSCISYKIYSGLVMGICIALYPFLVMKDLVTLDFTTALPSWFTVLAYILITPLCLTFYFQQSTIGDLLNKLEEEPLVGNPDELEDEVKLTLLKWYRLKNIQGFLFILSIVTSVGGQSIYSLLLRLTRSDSSEWKLGYGEFVNITYSPNFEIVYVFETVSVFYSTLITSTIIVIISGVLDYIAAQFNILQHYLRTLLNRAKRSLSQDNVDNEEIPWITLTTQMKNCMQYHICIINVLQEFEALFTYPILCLFISVLSMMCIDIYRASLFSLQDLRSYRILSEIMAVSIALFLVSRSGENMANESERIADAIYEVDFVGTDVRFQKCLVILMRQSQKPVRIKAGKFIDISLVTFAQILKASYSAYAMLKSTNENEM